MPRYYPAPHTSPMTLAVRFRYFSATTPSFDIVELNDQQWREFFLLERSYQRRDWMIHFLHREHLAHKIKELWWIPIDDQSSLQLAPSVIIQHGN